LHWRWEETLSNRRREKKEKEGTDRLPEEEERKRGRGGIMSFESEGTLLQDEGGKKK